MIAYHKFGIEQMPRILAIYRAADWCAYLTDNEKLTRAFQNSLYVLGAFDCHKLIGFVRCVGDGEHILYIQDLIVDPAYRRQGVGRELMQRTMKKFAQVRMLALATDAADMVSNTFYAEIGMRRFEDAECTGYLR